MSIRKRPLPAHGSPHELRLWAIVDSLVMDISEKEAYLSFARELALSLRRGAKDSLKNFGARLLGGWRASTCSGRTLPGHNSPVEWAVHRLPGGSICRYSTRYDRTRDCWYFKSNNMPNNDENDFRNNCWNDNWNSARNKAGLRLRLRSRYWLRFRRRYACRRKRACGSGYFCKYFLANLSGYFAANAKEKNERGIKPSRGWSRPKLQAIRTDVFNVSAPIAP